MSLDVPQWLKRIMSQIYPMIYVVGPRRLQNELIAAYLEREIGAQCLVGENIGEVCFPDDAKREGQLRLVLWDCQEMDLGSLPATPEPCDRQKAFWDYLVAFNVSHGLGIEVKCVRRGVRGIFYDQDSLAQFLRGVRAILSGQVWISREIMMKCLKDDEGRDSPLKTESILTPREIEILAEVAVGAKNEMIADKLCISAHTVKTHLYHIYKKINVPNRLQASLWAASNL